MYTNPNFFPLANSKTLHLDLGPGDLSNRIVTVGTINRAEVIAASFDHDRLTTVFSSHRGFHTISGYFENVFVSVVAIGMGVSMMDFFVREARAIVEGPMVIVRFGTCGGIDAAAEPGTIVVASQGSAFISRNPDAFHSAAAHENLPDPYQLHKIVPADAHLSARLVEALGNIVGTQCIVEGVNITADSFYSSQGRKDDRFDDRNENLIDGNIKTRYPNARSLEMESFYLLHLAHSSKLPIKASAAAIVVANRLSSRVIDEKVLAHLEKSGGKAVLATVCAQPL
jgi:uridine phosphorylase